MFFCFFFAYFSISFPCNYCRFHSISPKVQLYQLIYSSPFKNVRKNFRLKLTKNLPELTKNCQQIGHFLITFGNFIFNPDHFRLFPDQSQTFSGYTSSYFLVNTEYFLLIFKHFHAHFQYMVTFDNFLDTSGQFCLLSVVISGSKFSSGSNRLVSCLYTSLVLTYIVLSS